MRRVSIAGIAVTALLLAGCSGSNTGDGSGAGASDEPIVIGVQSDFTGAGQFGAIGARYGIEMAVEEVNKSGGIGGRQIKLAYGDSLTTPDGGVLANRKLIQQDKVVGIVSCSSGTSTIPASKIAASLKTPFIACSTDPALLDGKSPYVYHGISPSPDTIVDALEAMLKERFAGKSVAVVNMNSSTSYLALAERLKARLPADGFKVATTVNFQATDTDFTVPIQDIRKQDPDVIFFNGFPDAAGKFVRAARDAGLTQPMIGDWAPASQSFLELAGATQTEGILVQWPAAQYTSDDTGAMGKFRAAFKAKYPDAAAQYPNINTLWGYSDAYALIAGLKGANGKTDADSIVAALDRLKDFEPGSGEFSSAFKVGLPRTYTKDDHDGSGSVTWLEVKGGKFQAVPSPAS